MVELDIGEAGSKDHPKRKVENGNDNKAYRSDEESTTTSISGANSASVSTEEKYAEVRTPVPGMVVVTWDVEISI